MRKAPRELYLSFVQ